MSDAAPTPATPPKPRQRSPRWLVGWAAFLAVLCLGSLGAAWTTQQRVRALEQELVRRQADSQGQATEAKLLAKQAQDLSRDAAAKVSLVDVRVTEAALQRSQLEELIQSLSRSRDENMVADIESAIRVAMQQSAITGSTEPLLATLKQADERLARHKEPRLEGVRRALARDLDRAKAVGTTDIASLTIRLDEVVRQIDELPLLAVATATRDAASKPAAKPAAPMPRSASPASAPREEISWLSSLDPAWRAWLQRTWGDVRDEARALVRVTRIDHPEAMLVTPEQQFFLRENLKLRLLNARLAVLSRQFDIAQSDLREAQSALERYFDRSSRRVSQTIEVVRQVSAQARQTNLPRPDETLAALATAGAGR
ncbi:MAG TPA: uroporphyrinogen-III C-methyltransferase [Burkholderiaceae bacterium]|nr:uroporphyrinogen-III C-methyltransferase [Burkholderiaceae bacterium]